MIVITLRFGKQTEVPIPIADLTPERENEIDAQKRQPPDHAGPSSSNSDVRQPPIPLPFPPRAIPNKKMEEVDKEILETFRKVEVNIPLLDALKQIPRYAKFLKELCTPKRKLKGNERISMGKNVSALIGKSVPHIPNKCKDPSTFCYLALLGTIILRTPC